MCGNTSAAFVPGGMVGYSNFDDTFRIYADAMATSCVIVADDMAKAQKAKACGARHGCSLCTAVWRDHSMENMLEVDPRYAYMRGLNQLQRFLVNTRWDMNRRAWIGRTINDGWITIQPDAYSPSMMEELLNYALTIDITERESAASLGLPAPRFQLVTAEQLFAIDAMWSLQGFHKPFHALFLYNKVQHEGKRFVPPAIEPFPQCPMPSPRYLWVGNDWDEGHEYKCTGLRDISLEMHAGSYCMGTRTLASGLEVLDVEVDNSISFDPEAMYFILEYELPELFRTYHDNPKACPTNAFKYYLRLGSMAIKAGAEAEYDAILRRTAFKTRNGLHGPVDIEDLKTRSVSAAEKAALDNEVRPERHGTVTVASRRAPRP
jgi:DNA sulfur modification protein DndC